MKALTTMALLVLSLNAFSANIQDCQVDTTKVKDVVVLNETGNSKILEIKTSTNSEQGKKDLIKKILYIESISIGDGKGFCELATKQYKVTEEKCLKVMKSSDLISSILEEYDESENIGLECVIGVNAKLLMQFNM